MFIVTFSCEKFNVDTLIIELLTFVVNERRNKVLNSGKRLAESGVLLALFAIMIFIVTYIPILGVVLTFLLPVPIALVAIKYNLGWSFLFLLASSIITLIIGNIVFVPITLLFGIVGIIMGYYIQTNKSHLQMFIVSVLVFISGILAMLIGVFKLADINFDSIIAVIEQSTEKYSEMLASIGQAEQSEQVFEMMTSFLEMVQILLPSILVLSSIIFVAIVFLACRPLINRFSSGKLNIAPVRNLQLPKSLLWYYLFIMIGSLFIDAEKGDFMYTAILNITYCLQFLLLLQGISLIFFFSETKRWSKAVPITIVTFSLLLPLASIVRILGIMDLGFQIREKLVHK